MDPNPPLPSSPAERPVGRALAAALLLSDGNGRGHCRPGVEDFPLCFFFFFVKLGVMFLVKTAESGGIFMDFCFPHFARLFVGDLCFW